MNIAIVKGKQIVAPVARQLSWSHFQTYTKQKK
jgi:hypothetical protein